MSGYVTNGVPNFTGVLTGIETVLMDTELTAGLAPQCIAVQTNQLRARQYQQSSPLTGATVQTLQSVSIVQVTPAGAIAALTLVLPAAPVVDGQIVKLFSTQIITTLTINPSAGQTINGAAVTTLATANSSVEYIYQASNSTWYRIG